MSSGSNDPLHEDVCCGGLIKLKTTVADHLDRYKTDNKDLWDAIGQMRALMWGLLTSAVLMLAATVINMALKR
jgi:hypothetical protein